MSFNVFREKANIWLYDSKHVVLRIFKFISLLVSLGAIGLMVAYYGFPQTESSKTLLLELIKGSFAYFVFHYIAKIVYDFDPLNFIKRTWFEGTLMLLLTVEAISYNFFDFLIIEQFFIQIGLVNFSDLSNIFIQLYLLATVLTRIFFSSGFIPNIRLHPALIFILSFAFIILGGTALFMLPEMTTINGSMPFLDALFTSTSATCVTGLIVVDTATYFSYKGQMVMLLLIKIGGLNIIAFGTFLGVISRLGIRIKHHSVIEDFVNTDSVFSSKRMFGKIIVWSTVIEILGSLLLFFLWNPDIPFKSIEDKLFFSVFHSVSAFNNAGLSLFTDGLFNEYVRYNFLVHIIVTILVFFGALGFNSIFNLFSPAALRERLQYPWKHINFSTKISLYFSIGLVLFGAICFFLLEQNYTLKNQNFVEQIITSIFQSVTRTSGFNTVDISALSMPMILIMLFLMFVGSSSSSTGGGIKTSTFSIMSASVYSTIKGVKHASLFKRSIPNDLVVKAFAVFAFFVMGNVIAIFILSISETELMVKGNRTIMDLIFEAVSAMGTVGLSTGITSQLSDTGKYTIILSMFYGRVGTLTVAYAFGKSIISKNYKYPTGHTMVG